MVARWFDSIGSSSSNHHTMRIVKINTTAFSEEDFLLMTDLTDAQIQEVIAPMVKKERKGKEFYTNEDYFWALKEAFPQSTIDMYQESGIDMISF